MTTERLLTGTARKIDGSKPYELRGRREDGSQYRERFRTRKEMEDFDRFLYERKMRHRRGMPTDLRAVTYAGLVEIVLEQETGGGSRWKREMLAYSLAEFGAVQVRRLSSDAIGRWIANLRAVKDGRPLSGKTRQHVLAALRAVLERGVVQGFLDANPARAAAVRAPRAEQTDVFPFASWDEVFDVAQGAGPYGPMIRFACATGLRPEEYLALTWADVDCDRRQCHVRRTVVHGRVKASGKTRLALRTVVLTDQALAALDALPSPIRQDQLVFPAPKGGHINLNNLRNRVWHKALAAAGLPARPLYQTRHTFATLALEATGDLAWVSYQLGHADIQITRKHYARYLPSVHQRNLEKLNERWGSDRGVSAACHATEA